MRVLWFLAYLALVSYVGCLPVAEADEEAPIRRPSSTRVVVARVQKGSLSGTWTFPGEVRARARSSLAFGADGPVRKVTVEVGDHFTRGTTLVEVDLALALARRAMADARSQEAEEAYLQAQREAKRLTELPQGVVPEQEREQAVSRRNVASAALAARRAEAAEAKAILARHAIRAPFNGVVSERFVDRGDWVRVGDPALEVVATGPVDIIVDGSSALLGKVKIGDKATLVGHKRPQLRVAGLVPALDPSTRTLRIRLEPLLPEKQKAADVLGLVAGSSVQIVFTVELSDPEGLLVPEDGLIFDGRQTRLVKAVNGKAQIVESIDVLARSDGRALIRSSDLVEGDQVLIRGNERVQPDQPLEIKEL